MRRWTGEAKLATVATAAVLLLLNVWSWAPSIGGRWPDQPPGAEIVELFGFPAIWRADRWESDDVRLIPSALETAPFRLPTDRMARTGRITRQAALAYNLTFAAAGAVGVGLAVDAHTSGRWTRRRVGMVAALAAAGVGMVAAAPLVRIERLTW
ncbi:hypothetical protein GobsT_43850 [Gemmata obscuriglobus]|uniref:Uncharacterized protein n=1 Tax=Gemmata obscuriglobus TaxID=114 RepID=A0A2Z3H7H8_9BACT|nr:hypothetical protein [Gemmata obscuriglobus]AWM37624.1 hypothetical protein C1280_11860 [Gemmata obscuriglobus]QEG29587.1 hypothetical protein GobsT_43850 [Gemmata obscuriglobus]VTS08855.1 unnamed protein product [Gemmata obscuriglobus UQM 2246]